MTDRDLLAENGKLRFRVHELEQERDSAISGLMTIASMTQTTNLLWWQNKARETLIEIGVDVDGGKE
jgi:hypothetical protein